MNDTALGILIGYSVLVILFVTIGLIIFRSTRVGFKVETASRDTLEKREGYWGIAVVAFLVIVLGGTILQVPYWSDKHDPVEQNVNIVGRQFAWTVDPPRIRVGQSTRFSVRAADVSHGLGIYDPDNVLVRQVNVLPGVTQSLVITFDKPGIYKLRCLEFCGVDHHLMENRLEVTR